MKNIYAEPILIADDIEVNLMLLKSYIKKNFSTIYTAQNGVEAYELSKKIRFICIVLDIQMPIVNGLDATELIRKRDDSLNKETPILGITAASRVNYELLCLEKGMNSVLYKPVTREIVLNELEKCIEGDFANITRVDDAAEKQNNSSIKQLPFEYKRALEEFAGDDELLNIAVTQFANDLQEQIETMDTALKIEDYETVFKIAHKIRGAAANITAFPISEVAGMIEDNDDSDYRSQISNQIFLLNERVKEFFNKIIQSKLYL